jgi:hypothetical protein
MPLSDRQLHYYDKLRTKWPELGAPTASDADVAAMKEARAVPHPVEPDVPHWVEPVIPEQKAEAAQHHEYQRAAQNWHQAWSSFWETEEILAKIEKLNERPLVDGTEPTGRMIVVAVDPQGRQILEPERRPAKVPGATWWEENGYSGPISAADLHTIFERHDEVLS